MSDKGEVFWKEAVATRDQVIEMHQRSVRTIQAAVDGQSKIIHYLCDHMKENFHWTNEVEEQVNKLSLEMLDEISMHTGDSP